MCLCLCVCLCHCHWDDFILFIGDSLGDNLRHVPLLALAGFLSIMSLSLSLSLYFCLCLCVCLCHWDDFILFIGDSPGGNLRHVPLLALAG